MTEPSVPPAPAAPAAPGAGPRLMLLDTASLYFRAYFGVPETVRAPDGTPVNAVRGLLEFITRLVADHRPTHLTACLDADWRPAWRVELVPTYKTHRVVEDDPGGGAEELPDTLAPQVPVIEEVLDALGIARLGAGGYEADDVIGTLATSPALAVPGGPDAAVNIVTGDRDLFQLVDDERRVRVLYPLKGVGSLQLTDQAMLREKYGVADGEGYAQLALLRGDPSDGLPGVPGVGEKTALKLLEEYGSVAGVQAAAADPASKLTPARRAKLVASREYLAAAEPVIRVARDVPVPDGFDAGLPGAPGDAGRVRELGERWGLGGSLARLLEVLGR